MPRPADQSAEVIAAQRALSTQQPVTTRSNTGVTIPVHSPIDAEVESLLNEMASAERIDIVGVMPWECTGRLIHLEAERGDPPRQITVRYFTPSRERVAAYRHGGVLGTVVQRWIAGVTGLRNWLLKGRGSGSEADPLSIFEFDDVFLDCVVSIRRGGVDSVTVLSRLPMTTIPTGERDQMATAKLIVTRLPGLQSEGFHEYLDRLAGESTPLVPRQVRCRAGAQPPQPATDGEEFRPLISRLSAYGRMRPGDIEPIAVVAVCAKTASGPTVLLKRRTRENARDDFDKLSLISERVLAEDFVTLLNGPLDADPDRALDDLWLRAGQPESFEVPELVFRNAAQRELFLSCGIDVDADRLRFCGTCLVDRDGEETYLGFFVYRIDLVRTPQDDEYKRAVSWNPHLESVPIADLYRPQPRHRLNRLLIRRETWLRETVFASPPGTP